MALNFDKLKVIKKVKFLKEIPSVIPKKRVNKKVTIRTKNSSFAIKYNRFAYLKSIKLITATIMIAASIAFGK